MAIPVGGHACIPARLTGIENGTWGLVYNNSSSHVSTDPDFLVCKGHIMHRNNCDHIVVMNISPSPIVIRRGLSQLIATFEPDDKNSYDILDWSNCFVPPPDNCSETIKSQPTPTAAWGTETEKYALNCKSVNTAGAVDKLSSTTSTLPDHIHSGFDEDADGDIIMTEERLQNSPSLSPCFVGNGRLSQTSSTSLSCLTLSTGPRPSSSSCTSRCSSHTSNNHTHVPVPSCTDSSPDKDCGCV